MIILIFVLNFHIERLLPELNHMRSPLPPTLPYLWGDYKTLNREVLVLEREGNFECAPNKSSGLDLPHVLLAVEWLAKLHGLSYVAKKTFEKENPQEDWLKMHPWIRREIGDNSNQVLSGPHVQGA